MGPFFSFVGVEGGKVRPRAAVVAGLVAALALLAVLRGGPTASAVVPTSYTLTVTQSPAGGTPVDPGPGNIITYVVTLNLGAPFDPTSATDMITVELNVDSANLAAVTRSCSAPSGVTIADSVTGAEHRCSWSAASLPTGVYVFVVQAYAKPGGDNDVDSPTDIEVCYDQNGNSDCDDEPAGNQLSVGVTASVGVLTINPNTVSPATTTVPAGTPVTITWTLRDGYTCESDANEADGVVSCDPGDVTFSPSGVAAVSGLSIGDPDMADETTVAVTIINTTPGPVTVVAMLKTKFEGNPVSGSDPDDIDPDLVGVDDVMATVTFTVGPGRLMGDVDCDNNVTAADALKILRYLAGLPVSQTEPCPDIGTPQ
jgi:hypothetical protein